MEHSKSEMQETSAAEERKAGRRAGRQAGKQAGTWAGKRAGRQAHTCQQLKEGARKMEKKK